MQKAVVFGLSLLVLGACTTTPVGLPYAPSAANALAIESRWPDEQSSVQVAPFNAAANVRDMPECRGVGGLDVTLGKSVAAYIQEAFQTELLLAQRYATDSPIVLTATLTNLELSTMSDPSWNLTLSISSSNGTSYVVTTRYPMRHVFAGAVACQNAANAFMPAVQQLISGVISHPDFGRLLEPQTSS